MDRTERNCTTSLARLAALTVLAATVLASGCSLVPEVNEESAFIPSGDGPPAASVADMGLIGEDRLPAGTTVAHGLIGAGEQQLAWTLVSREDNPERLVVHCGGNASYRNRDGVTYAAKALGQGDVLIFDYPGFGDSRGMPSPQSIERTVAEIAALAREQLGDRTLLLWGHSIGGFICASMLEQLPDAEAMVFETSARSAAEIARRWTPAPLRPFIAPRVAPSLARFDNCTLPEAFTGKVAVFAAAKDTVLPADLSMSLADCLTAAGRPVSLTVFPDANHANVPDAAGFQQTVADFLPSTPMTAPADPAAPAGSTDETP